MKLILISLAAVIALAALPLVLPPSMVIAAIQMLVAALFATAYGMLIGRAGMLSFGHAAYFGIGAFAAIHAMNAVEGAGLLPTPLIPVAGGLAGLILGGIAGYLSSKRSGTYFAMITLALAELLHAIAPNLAATFGGEGGISTFRMPAWGIEFGSTNDVYYLTLFWVVFSVLLLYGLTRTPFGLLMLGLRENTQRLKFLGYNTHLLATMAFAVSAMFTGIAGSLQTLNLETANYVLFEVHVSTVVVLNTFIGGAKIFLGPAVGAAAMTFFGHVSADMTRSWLLYQGLIFVLVMMYMPRGLVGELVAVVKGESKPFKYPTAFTLRLAGVVVVGAGGILGIELLQRFFSMDYAAQRAGGNWPAVQLFGQEWLPFALSTWAVPLIAMGLGAAALWYANRSETELEGRK